MISTCQDDSAEPMPEVKLDRLNKDKDQLKAVQGGAVTATSEARHLKSLFEFSRVPYCCAQCAAEKQNKQTMTLIYHQTRVLRSESIAAKAMRSKEIFTKHFDSVLQKTAKLRSLQSDLVKHYDNTDEVVRK